MHSQKDDTGTSTPKWLLPWVPRAAAFTCGKGALAEEGEDVSWRPGLHPPDVGSPCPPRSNNQKYLQALPAFPEGKNHTHSRTAV